MPLNIILLKSVFNLKSLGFKRGYRKYKLSLFCEGGRGVCAFENVPIFFVPISEGGEGWKEKGTISLYMDFFFLEGIPYLYSILLGFVGSKMYMHSSKFNNMCLPKILNIGRWSKSTKTFKTLGILHKFFNWSQQSQSCFCKM